MGTTNVYNNIQFGMFLNLPFDVLRGNSALSLASTRVWLETLEQNKLNIKREAFIQQAEQIQIQANRMASRT